MVGVAFHGYVSEASKASRKLNRLRFASAAPGNQSRDGFAETRHSGLVARLHKACGQFRKGLRAKVEHLCRSLDCKRMSARWRFRLGLRSRGRTPIPWGLREPCRAPAPPRR
jgi:hypothetical protein